jgi:hypothetical protein
MTNNFDRNQQQISDTCDEVKALLLEKNKAYGDSALNPVRIFSKASPVEQLKVRIDDKLSRLARGEAAGEDVFKDLLGYMVLLRIAMDREQGEVVLGRVVVPIPPRVEQHVVLVGRNVKNKNGKTGTVVELDEDSRTLGVDWGNDNVGTFSLKALEDGRLELVE